MNTIRKVLIAALVSTSLAVSSYAGAVLQIYTASTGWLVIDDNSVLAGLVDTNSGASRINWSGSAGGWDIAVAAALTVQGGTSPIIDLSVQATSTTAGDDTLKVFYGDNNFGPSASNSGWGLMTGHTTGTAGSIWFAGGYNEFNNSYGSGAFGSDTVTGSPFTAQFSGTLAPDALLYSLQEQVNITNTGDSFTSLDAIVGVPDSGSTALLIGLGLLGLGISRRNKSVA